MRYPVFLYLCVVFLPVSPVAADFYRCVGEAGEPEFRQQPCGATAVSAAPAGRGSISDAQKGLRPTERSWLKARESGKRQKSVKRIAGSKTDGAKKAQKQAHRCLKKRRALDAVNAELRRGYKPSRGDSLRRRQRAHRDYLESLCS